MAFSWNINNYSLHSWRVYESALTDAHLDIIICSFLLILTTRDWPAKPRIQKSGHEEGNFKVTLRQKNKVLTPSAQLPVNDSMPVQEHQSRRDLCGVKTGTCFVELPRPLNLKHQIASVDILHDEKQPILEKKKSHFSNAHNYMYMSRPKCFQ